MTHMIELSPEIDKVLEKVAARHGQQPTDYMRSVVVDALALDAENAKIDAGWESLNALIDRCQIETGITDLAHQHDHYIHGTPKRED